MPEERRRRKRSSRSGVSDRQRRPLGGIARAIVKAVVIASLSLVGIWLIAAHFGANDIASTTNAPWPGDGAYALVGKGRAALGATPPAIADAKASARAALAVSPLNVDALEVFARAAMAEGDEQAVAKYRKMILDRTLRNYLNLVWEFDEAVNRRDFDTAMSLANAALRQSVAGEAATYLMRRMTVLASDPEAFPAIAAQMGELTTWRRSFLDVMATRGDINIFPELMDARRPKVRGGVNWPTYFNRLIARGESRMAYVIWTEQLDPETAPPLGLLFNGGFESEPTGMPFDWSVTPGRGFEIVRDDRAPGEGAQSLRITFGGAEVRFANLRQTLILDPGAYSFSGLVKTSALETRLGLQFRIYCLDTDSAVIAQSPLFAGTAEWSRFSIDFTVPPQYCNYQTIRLEIPAKIAADRRVQGSIWFDGLDIARRTDSSSSAQDTVP